MTNNITAEELRAIREMRNAANRAWWAKMTAEQRKAKRLEYALNRARKLGMIDAAT